MRITRNQYFAEACRPPFERQEPSMRQKALELEAMLDEQLREARRQEAVRNRQQASREKAVADTTHKHVAEKVIASLKNKVLRKYVYKDNDSKHLEGKC